MKVKEADIIDEWIKHSNHYTFPNTYIGHYEADLIEITKSGYAYEYEVKLSRSDFKADAKKKWVSALHKTTINVKAELLEQGKRVNYFYYVVPRDMISVEEIPDYAGLIYVNVSDYVKRNGDPNISFSMIRGATRLTKEKLGDKILNKSFMSTYYKFHRLRTRIKELKKYYED